MRALLVYPEFPRSYWGFQYSLHLAGKRASLPPLGLCTLAAHLPESWELRLVDLNIGALDDDALGWADVVLVGGMLVQEPSMRDVIARARRAGRTVVAGGPAVATCPERFAEADLTFGGEIEGREDELVAALEQPGRGPRHLAPAKGVFPDLASCRVPRFDLLDLDAYSSMAVQYSRGCPFHCEFCDIIEIFGRVPRVKTNAQVIAELEALDALGWQGTVFFVDDNFIGNRRQVRTLLPEIRRFQEAHGFPIELYTEASIDLARETDLARGMRHAGFTAVFVGLETPSKEALAETGKHQNLQVDLAEAVRSLSRLGLEVMAGFIVGFDCDGPDAFEAQWRFLEHAPIPKAMAGLLIALPGTALSRRLEAGGRLRARTTGDQFGRPNFDPRMDEATLLVGYADLLARLYHPDSVLERCLAYLRLAPPPPATFRARKGGVAIVLRTILHLGVLGARRRQFWTLLAGALRRSPRFLSWAIAHAIQGEHLVRYTREDVLPRLAGALEALTAERARSPRAAEARPGPAPGIDRVPALAVTA